MAVRREKVATEGFRISSVGCALQKVMGGSSRGTPRCEVCAQSKKMGRHIISRLHNHHDERADLSTPIEHITYNPEKGKLQTVCPRKEVKRLTRKLV